MLVENVIPLEEGLICPNVFDCPYKGTARGIHCVHSVPHQRTPYCGNLISCRPQAMTCGFASPEETKRMRIMAEEALKQAYYHAGIIPGRSEGEAQGGVTVNAPVERVDTLREATPIEVCGESKTGKESESYHAGSNPAPEQPKPRPIIRRCVQGGEQQVRQVNDIQEPMPQNDSASITLPVSGDTDAPGQDKEPTKAKKIGLGILDYMRGGKNGNS